MGLPLGPTFANLFLCFHEKKWLEECPSEFKPIIYRRYIDDTFLLFKTQENAKKFLDYLNTKHRNIKFTCEFEENNHISFLDVNLERRDDKIYTSVFRKSTFSGQGMSFFSECSERFKLNSIKTLVHRAYEISSSYVLMHSEFSFLKKFFGENGLPTYLIDNAIKRLLDSKFDKKPEVSGCPKKKVFLSLPYFGQQSISMAKELSRSLSKFYPHISFQMIQVNSNRIGSLFKYKDKLPKNLTSQVVYKFCCAKCNDASYVGSTTRALQIRVAE